MQRASRDSGFYWHEAEGVLVVAKGAGNLNAHIKAIGALLRIEEASFRRCSASTHRTGSRLVST